MSRTCADCKKVNGISCCEVWVGDSPTMPLSLPEVRQIAKSTKKKPSEFTVVERVDPFEASGQEILSPVFKSLHAGESRIRLKTVPSEGRGDIERCVFLGETGCSLQKSDRPYGCRLYPFTYNSGLAKSETGGLVRYPTGSTCLAAEQAPTDDAKLAALIGTSQSDLIKLGREREVAAKAHVMSLTKEK